MPITNILNKQHNRFPLILQWTVKVSWLSECVLLKKDYTFSSWQHIQNSKLAFRLHVRMFLTHNTPDYWRRFLEIHRYLKYKVLRSSEKLMILYFIGVQSGYTSTTNYIDLSNFKFLYQWILIVIKVTVAKKLPKSSFAWK